VKKHHNGQCALCLLKTGDKLRGWRLREEVGKENNSSETGNLNPFTGSSFLGRGGKRQLTEARFNRFSYLWFRAEILFGFIKLGGAPVDLFANPG
jgi:hypothetical protein